MSDPTMPPVRHRCEHAGCAADSIPCYLATDGPYGPDREPSERLCPEHASEAGYCAACGLFGAGMDRFDFGPGKGYCDTCYDEIRAENAEPDEDEGEYFDDLP